MKSAILALALAALAGASTSAAQAPAPKIEDPEATVVAGLVVRGVIPGPAWWIVRNGASTVYILGVPEAPVAKGLTWDQAALQRRLTGASALIAPIQAKAGLGDIPALLGMRSRLRSKTPMEQGLPAPLRARFEAARLRLGKPASRYAGWDPIIAGVILVDDFEHAAGTTSKEPMAEVRKAASHAHTPVRPAASYRVVGLLKPMVRSLTPEVSQTCLGEALDEVEAGPAALDAVGAAWAKGDTAGVLAGPRGLDNCLLLLQGGADFWRQSMAEDADAVAASLARPGHAVAMFQIRSLVAEDGVLARLKARGFQITSGRD
jgi:uncharacterized protein YbaP (TraB family)